jgi:RimJ/RimL family protein N-acetyltransferase
VVVSTGETVGVTFTPVDVRGADRGEFTRFMTRNSFPFHLPVNPADEDVAATIDSGRYDNRVPLWVEEAEHGRIGLAVLERLAGSTPKFDLRLAGRYRARGLGVPILGALTTHVFGGYAAANRLEGQTREDNYAMRKTFLRSGFVKEVHRRASWPVEGGTPLALVTYAILRDDWASGTTTQFDWEDSRLT